MLAALKHNDNAGNDTDNWLLAKKPINGYCASCEAMIRGDLDKRTEYVAWNKYPAREDKSYRLGHGFSRMLQMVNDDILKSSNDNKEEEEKPEEEKSETNIEDYVPESETLNKAKENKGKHNKDTFLGFS